MAIYEFGADLYLELCNRGFDPKASDGRDNSLYLELKQHLGCGSLGLLTFLRKVKLPAIDFIATFFRVAEPFSLMYRDILDTLRHQGTPRTSESVKIRFNTGTEKFDIDLSQFVQWEAVQQTIRRMAATEIWLENDLLQLTDLFGLLGVKSSFRSPIKLDPLNPVPLPPPPPTGSADLDGILEKVHEVLQFLTDEVIAYLMSGQTSPLAALQEHAHPDSRSNSALTVSDRLVYDLLPMLSERYLGVIERIVNDHWPRDELESIRRFWAWLSQKLITIPRDRNIAVKTFQRILDLPFWRYRWYVYEVWTTLRAVSTLADYGATLESGRNHQLMLSRGSESKVASFKDGSGRQFVLLAQKQTPVVGIPGRQAIAPDLRIAQAPGNNATQTIVLVECKQRRSMQAKHLRQNVALYEQGAPSSKLNVFVNYDRFPKLKNTAKTLLISDFQPKHPAALREFRESIRSALLNAGIMPPPTYDALLIDISGSMQDEYKVPETIRNIEKLIARNPGISIFFFNDKLIEPAGRSRQELAKELSERAVGSTRLDEALRTLRLKHSSVHRVLVLTDQQYSEPIPTALREQFDITERHPRS